MAELRSNCKDLRFTLLDLLQSPAMAVYYVRELESNTKCDLQDHREQLRRQLGPQRTQRIVNYVGTDSDEVRAIRLFRQQADGYRREIWSQLSWIERIQYALQKPGRGWKV